MHNSKAQAIRTDFNLYTEYKVSDWLKSVIPCSYSLCFSFMWSKVQELEEEELIRD